MSGECPECSEHALECKCKGINMKRWISIGDYIINPEYFNMFYIEEVPTGQYHLFGEDKHQVSWRLMQLEYREEAEMMLDCLASQIQD